MDENRKASEHRDGVTGTVGPYGERTKTLFHALRDMAGLDGETLAGMLGLSGPQWIHRWERDGQQDPPLDAWQTVENAARQHWEMVDAILHRVHGQDLTEGTRIDLTYYRSQAEHDRYGRDRGPYRQVNAVSLHAGLLLTQAGYEIAYVAPQTLPPVERAGIRLTRDSGASGRI